MIVWNGTQISFLGTFLCPETLIKGVIGETYINLSLFLEWYRLLHWEQMGLNRYQKLI